MTTTDYGLARRMRHQLEPIHALFWSAPEVFEVAAEFGYDTTTRWPSYFAWRSTPLGTAGPKLRAADRMCRTRFADLIGTPALAEAADLAREAALAAGTAGRTLAAANAELPWPAELEWRTDRLADGPWLALGADRAERLAGLTRPLLGAAFESALLPSQSTLGIAGVAFPAPRP